MSKYYVPDDIRMKIGELCDEGYCSKRIAAMLGLSNVYVGWMLRRYRAYGTQGLMLKARAHISFDGKVEVVTDIMNNSLSYKAAALKYNLSPAIVGRWMHIVEEQFEEIAEHLLHGGYFLVSGADMEPYRVYLHTVEFYYHEEKTKDPKFMDLIVYHRNCKSERVAPKRAFKIGTLNAHQSGIDITFEDNSNMKDPAYRASALIRCFKVKDLKDGEWVDREFAKPKDKTRPTVEAYPLHLYEYLFMKQVLTDVCVKWVDTPVTEESLHTGPRINVYEYNSSEKKDKTKPDPRERAYSIEPFPSRDLSLKGK